MAEYDPNTVKIGLGSTYDDAVRMGEGPLQMDPAYHSEATFAAQKEAEDRKSPTYADADKPLREKKKVTNKNLEIDNFEQHLLTKNIDKTTAYYNSKPGLFNYLTFRQVNGKGHQLINKLRGIDNLDVFYKMKTSVLSLMQPKIRLYKVLHEQVFYDHAGRPDPDKTKVLSSPCYREFKFSDNFGVETAATAQDYMAYESTTPTYRNVGIESFSYEWDGRKHGIVEHNISCTLKLKFKSLKDLNAQPPGEPPPEKGGIRYVDLILHPPARYLGDFDTYNPKHYEIKALVGYTAPSKEQLNGLNLSDGDIKAISSIEKLNVIISLTLTDYNLDIAEDGRVTMTAKYRGRIETTIGSTQVNVFQNSFTISEGGKLKITRKADAKHNMSHVFKLISQIQALNRELNKKRHDTADAQKKLDAMLKNPLLSHVKKMLEAAGRTLDLKLFKDAKNTDVLIKGIQQQIGAFKADIYKTFVDQLIDGNIDSFGKGPGTRLFCFNAPKGEILDSIDCLIVDDRSGVSIDEENQEQISLQECVDSATTAVPKGKPKIKVGRCNKTKTVDAKVKNDVAQEISNSIGLGQAKVDEARQTILSHSGNTHEFYFVYLGDIVELACKNAGLGILDFDDPPLAWPIFPKETYYPKDSNNKAPDYALKNMRILLGPLEYVDQHGATKIINLAQFPISFNYFRAWFMKKITRKRRISMNLGQFIHNMVKELVMPALGAGMPRDYKAARTHINTVALTLPGKSKLSADTKSCGTSGVLKEQLPLKRVLNVNSADFKLNYLNKMSEYTYTSETAMKSSIDYMLIYMTANKDITDRRGDPVEDLKDGIYHFNIGSDMGLLKSMDFKRVQIKDLTELRALQARNQGVDSLAQLKFPYNTTLNLLGTTLFAPGMKYYVNPSLAGLGDAADAGSLAYQMNLGGYHNINVISTTVSPGRFETRIIGQQTAQGKR